MAFMNLVNQSEGSVVQSDSTMRAGFVHLSGCKISSNVRMVSEKTPRGLPEGRIVSFNGAGEFETGVDNTADFSFPFLLVSTSQYDADVDSIGSDVDLSLPNPQPHTGAYVSAGPLGHVVAVPVNAAYLFATNQYNASTIVPNKAGQPLTAVRANTDPDVGGVLTLGSKSTHIVGFTVPEPITGDNPASQDPYFPNMQKVLYFFGDYIPKSA
jgi:hypothetical protein